DEERTCMLALSRLRWKPTSRSRAWAAVFALPPLAERSPPRVTTRRRGTWASAGRSSSVPGGPSLSVVMAVGLTWASGVQSLTAHTGARERLGPDEQDSADRQSRPRSRYELYAGRQGGHEVLAGGQPARQGCQGRISERDDLVQLRRVGTARGDL